MYNIHACCGQRSKILAIFLYITLLLLLVTACSSDPVHQVEEEEYTKQLSRSGELAATTGATDEDNQIEATLALDQTLFDSKQNIEATLELINNGTETIYYGGDYSIEQWEDGQWYMLTFKEALNFTSQLHHSHSGERFEQRLYVPAQLPAGKYRVVKSLERIENDAVSEPLETIRLAVEFEVQ